MDEQHSIFGGRLLKVIALLSLAAFGLYTTKSVLSDCTIFSKVNCRAEKSQVAVLVGEIVDIQRQVDQLLKSNSSLECPKPEVVNTSQDNAPKIDSSLWDKGDLEVLTGCWSLDWDYKMRREKTGEIVGVESWKVCFKSGFEAGSQTLIFEDGTSCIQRPIRGDFKSISGQSKLYLDDTKNVECSRGTYVYHRRMECELVQSDNHAMCAISQLESDGSWSELGANTVRLSRSKN